MEATAQVLERGGSARFTTNHIAHRAGYSIGTLYRYFPHKKAILKRIVETEVRRQEDAMRDVLAASDDVSSELLIERAVHTMLKPFASHSHARRSILQELIHDMEFIAGTHETQTRLVRRFHTRLHQSDPARFREPTDLLCLTLTNALLGCIRMTFFVEPEHLRDAEFQRELVSLVTKLVTNENHIKSEASPVPDAPRTNM